jgi:fucose 4-O-acetylase-like acetyltransferase
MIVIHHIYQYTSSRFGVSYPLPLAIILQSLGYLATGVFFLLSGYGLTFSMKRSEPISLGYSVKQLLKIYKPFLFIWFISVCVDLLFFKQYGYKEHVFNALTLNLTGGGSFWFLKEIFFIYLLSFVVYTTFNSDSTRMWIISICVILFIVIGSFFLLGNQWLNSIVCFPIGVVCYYNKDKLSKYNSFRVGFVLLSLFCLSFLCGLLVSSEYKYSSCLATIQLLFQLISVVSLSLYAIRFVSFVNVKNKIFAYTGKNSLCIYLYHLYCLALLSISDSIWLYILSVIISTLLLTYLYNKLDKVLFLKGTS